ncbi:MAG: hypothetical protein KDJ72_06085 [Methyloceanibacter sp.]|uniref:hypothetical protein n=1 Tax=Methyloceanibacter sp. TaxID=1965321 RepID=UPI001D4E8751|nr:hypothetical protein [Methyloceanibacter sp.]MCB1442575.1 hypothetical protein [Methyloceanibacter sp.]MCC0057942.1 hypothetical protein [Hyphomicrobiaceae bacterium]
MSSTPPYRPILGHQAGLTILATGTIKFAESKRIFDRMFSDGDRSDYDRWYRAQITYRHEVVHFLQTFTTAKIFQYCERVRMAANEFQKWLGNKERDAAALKTLSSGLAALERDLERETGSDPTGEGGVSARQLMEASAVLESLRSLTPSSLQITQLLDAIPQANRRLYGRVIGIMACAFSPSVILNLTPALVYLSLNAEDSGRMFCGLVRTLGSLPISAVERITPAELLDSYVGNEKKSLISMFAAGERLSVSPFWNELGSAFAKCGSIDLLHRVAAYPSSLLTESNWSLQLDDRIKQVMPPIFMFEDGHGQICGLARSFSDETIRQLLCANAMIGAMYRVARNDDYYNFCGQHECPAYSYALCHMAYPLPPPPHGDWRQCCALRSFEELTGNAFQTFAQDHLDA